MFFQSLISQQHTIILGVILIVFISSVCISFQTRFIQVRGFLYMLKLLKHGLWDKQKAPEDGTHILPIQSLFTAMSTSIGIGNIVGPIIAVKLGGISALWGFILAMLFGAASTFMEVYLAIENRIEKKSFIYGGPMQYLKHYLGYPWACLYAFTAGILLCSWCSSQSNTLAEFFIPYGVPQGVSGLCLAVFVFFILVGGIKRVAEFASSVVPWMFLVYSCCCCWIIACHFSQLPSALSSLFDFNLQTGGGFISGLIALRWGLAKGYQSNESGLGTSSIPHSMAGTNSPFEQALLAMAAVFSNGILCLLTGLVLLVTGAWKTQHLGIGINILKAIFQQHFFMGGEVLLGFCATLFVITTVLGNAYNGSQAFGFFTKNRYIHLYYFFISFFVFLGSMMDAEFAWTFIDFLLIPLALPHAIGLIFITSKISKVKEKITWNGISTQ